MELENPACKVRASSHFKLLITESRLQDWNQHPGPTNIEERILNNANAVCSLYYTRRMDPSSGTSRFPLACAPHAARSRPRATPGQGENGRVLHQAWSETGKGLGSQMKPIFGVDVKLEAGSGSVKGMLGVRVGKRYAWGCYKVLSKTEGVQYEPGSMPASGHNAPPPHQRV